MTNSSSQTLFAPNPPQLDDPLVRVVIVVLALCGLIAAISIS